jgi:hypothetical protein
MEKPQINVGYVIYTLGDEPGTLDAIWRHQTKGSGTGKATGGNGEVYAGIYQITYWDEQGQLRAEHELEIVQKDGYCDLAWSKDGALVTRGIGQETSAGLIVGFRHMSD